VDAATGDLDPWRAARLLLPRPWLWPAALRLARQQGEAEHRLAEALAILLGGSAGPVLDEAPVALRSCYPRERRWGVGGIRACPAQRLLTAEAGWHRGGHAFTIWGHVHPAAPGRAPGGDVPHAVGRPDRPHRPLRHPAARAARRAALRPGHGEPVVLRGPLGRPGHRPPLQGQ